MGGERRRTLSRRSLGPTALSTLTSGVRSEHYPQSGDLSAGDSASFRRSRTQWDAGLLRSRELLVSAELFEDDLELAEYLLSKGYKDPAAVVVGRRPGIGTAKDVPVAEHPAGRPRDSRTAERRARQA